jgi:hypothetical protein
VSPQSIRVRIPESDASKLDDESVVSAVITDAFASSLTSPGPQTFPVRLRMPDSLAGVSPLSASPDSARVTVTVRGRVESVKLASVPVWISLPPAELNLWKVEPIDPFVRDVTITGSQDLIDGINSRAITVIAMVLLSSDDLDAEIESKTALMTAVNSDLTSRPIFGTTLLNRENGLGSSSIAFDAPSLRVPLRITRRTTDGREDSSRPPN